MRRLKTILNVFLMITMVCWSLGMPFLIDVPKANAAGGIEFMYTDDGGATTDVYLNASSTPESILKITAYETETGANTIDSITIQVEPDMDCDGTTCTESPFNITDLGSISTASTSGISLWLDDGDGNFEFDTSQDTLISSTSAAMASEWTEVTITDDWGSYTVQQTVFSSLNLNIPTDWNAPLTVFVAMRAENNIDASTLHKFNIMIPVGGVNVTAVSTATISDSPSDYSWRFPPVTLGAEGSGDNIDQGTPILISEIQTAASTGNTTDYEFIELYNRTDQPFDLAGIKIAYTASTTLTLDTWTASTTLSGTVPAFGYFLIGKNAGYDGATTTNATYSTFSLDETGGFVGLISPDEFLMDKVGYGSLTDPSLAEGGSPAPAPPVDGSLERKAYSDSTPSAMVGGIDSTKGNGEDSNNNSADFIIRLAADNPDPQNLSSPTETSVIDANANSIIINEILYNASSGSGWIELYNASSTAISIDSWTLEVATTTTQTYTIPANHGANYSDLAGNSFLVIYWNQSGTDSATSTYTGAKTDMSTIGGDITLKNSGSAIIDYIQYGGSDKAGEAAAAAVGEWNSGDYIYNSDYSQSIARQGTAGDDYNTSMDWMYLSSPSPGYPNTGGDTTAPTAVTNVALVDIDAANYGLLGEDVRISWTPSATSDFTFDRYELYLLPDGTTLDTAQHSVYATIYGQYMWEGGVASSSYAFIAYGSDYDSAGNSLSNGNYRAYVAAVDFSNNRSSSISSLAAALASDAGGSDTMPPMIDHMPVWQAPDGTDLTFYARMGDDRGLATAELAYRTANPDTTWGNATSTCAQPAMAGNSGLYSCSVSWDVTWDDNTTLYYYLRAIDTAATPNGTYLGMYPIDTEATAKIDSINIDFIASTTLWNDASAVADLSGIIFDDTGNPLQDAFVIIDGISTTTATTTSTGTFTFQDNAMPSGSQFIRIIKDGYMEIVTDTDSNSNFIAQNASGLEFYLNSGYMSTSAGGSAGGNGIAWTAPGDGMMMAPTNIACTGDCSTIGSGEMPIMIGFFNQMNSATIDDMDASNAGSNIYLTTDGLTKVSGIKIKYDSNMQEARVYSDTALSTDTFYMVVITSGVMDNNGNSIESNRPSGNYEFSFSTMGDNSAMWGPAVGGIIDYGSFGGGGMYTPPYVVGTNPTPGSYAIPLNTSITVEFSETMDPSVVNAIKLYPITSESSWTAGSEIATTVTLDNATKKLATINPTSNLSSGAVDNGWYEIRIMGSAKSQLGLWMGDPSSCLDVNPDTCLSNTTHYSSSFQISSATDDTEPTIAGTYPSDNDGITNTSVVDVAIPIIEIGFNEAMDPSTINSQSVTLKKGTVSVSGIIKYDPMSNSAKFTPTGALTANNVYTLTITTSVTDLSGNALASNNIINFKTGSADTSNPNVLYSNGDDYQIAVTFSEPMNVAPQTDTANWAASVLNPANYYVNSLASEQACANPGSWTCSPTLTAPYNTTDGNRVSGINGITLSYDSMTQTVILKGFDMCDGASFGSCASDSFQIFVDNVADKSSNALTDSGNRSAGVDHQNASRAFLQNSAETYGMLGPGGGPGMMMGGGGPGGPASGGGPGMDMGQMGMFSGGAFPMNAMAGQTSSYMIDVPVTKALQNGMQIVLTFPTGFDVSSVAVDPYSPVNNDMNDWNNGTITFDSSLGVGGVASTTINTITIKLDVSGTVNSTAGPDGFIDFLHIDLKGIKNSSIPKDFGTSGYTVDIKTKSSDGALLENVSTMPFFITEGGSDSLTVVINSGNASQNTGTMNVYLGSWMTGPMEAESTTFTDGIGTSTFTNLISGDYMIFTDPFITIDSTNYLGKPMPEFIQVSGATSKTITLEQEGAGTAKAVVSVAYSGNFSTEGVADNIDIFAHSYSDFRVKTLNSVGNTTATTTMYLTEGEWSMGIGPAMPKGPMAGPPPMPDWMEPQMVFITVGVETIDSVNLDADGDATDAANSNNEPVLLNVSSTKNFQVGDTVFFSSAAASSTVTALVGDTSITVDPVGNWGTLPAGSATVYSVRESSQTSNDSNVKFDISNQSLKNIIGFVLDDSGNVLGDVEVYAYQPQGFGGGHTTTDTAGKFTLKIGTNGVWTVGAFKPGMPSAQEKSVEVKDDSSNVGTDGNSTADIYLNGTLIADASGDNAGTNPLQLKLKRPGYTISGKVLNNDGQAVPYAPVWAYQPTSWGNADTMTDATGNYILYVDAGTWRVETDAPGVGWMQYNTDITITTASQSNINLRPVSGTNFFTISGTVTIDGSPQTYMPIRAVEYNASGNYLGREYGASTDSAGQYTITAPAGIYRVDIWTPEYGEMELDYDQYSATPANINLDVATTTADITIAAVALKTISIQFTNGLASQTGFLNVEEVEISSGIAQPTGYHFSTDIQGLSATTTIKLKNNKDYFFNLDIPGYGFYTPDAASLAANGSIAVTANRTVYFTLPDANTETITISGTATSTAGSAIANAWIWLGDPSSNFHTGTESGSDGTFTLTVPSLASGSYKIGADKSGYMSPAPVDVSGTVSSAANTIILTANSLTISGYVYADADSDSAYDSGEALPSAWVWAEETSTGRMTHSPADATGYYELGVINGTWKISAGADGYADDSYRVGNTKTDITVSGISIGSKNIALSVNSNWTMKTKSSPITPLSGGTIDDTASSSTGVKLTIPPTALGQNSNTGNISIQETSAVAETSSAVPLGGVGKTITATDNNNTAITSLGENMYIDVELVYYKADIEAMNIVDYSKLKNLSQSYWDNSLDNWVNLSTTRKAYYKLLSSDTEWTLKPDNAATAQTGYEEFIDTLVAGTPNYYDYKLVLSAKSDHLTVFSATQPQDSLLPSSPAELSQSSGNGSSIGLSWSSVSTNSDSSAITDLLGYEVYRSTDNSTYTQLNTSDVTTTSYTDSTASSWANYYYKITAADDGGNETALANSTALQVCSNNSVDNGSVASDCTITCNTGYTLSGNTCLASGSSPVPSSSVTNDAIDETLEDITEDIVQEVEKIVEEAKEVVKEITDNMSDKARAFAQKIAEIASEAAETVKANINSLLNKFGFKRNLAKEQVAVKKYVKALIKNIANLTQENQYALTNFIAYGTNTTQILGEGERAGVVNSFKAALGKLPITEEDWNDVIKIANGRWPSQTNAQTEANAEAAFRKIYLRNPDRTNPFDDAAVTVMSYGLRPANRNLDSEKVAIKTFRHIYGYNPLSASAWDIVRAIAYSGATR